MTFTGRVNRRELTKALGGDVRLTRFFEKQARQVDETTEGTVQAVAATDALEDASVLTLSANGTLKNERVLALGEGLEGNDDGEKFTISFSMSIPRVSGGFEVDLVVSGDSVVRLPLGGQLATTENTETLKRKTLDAPKLSGLGNYADDTAAAVGGVPVGGVYRNGSQVMVRVI